MCGIAGIINRENRGRVDEALISKMTRSMTHRGPDASGIFVDCNVAFGHRRLKIIDLSDNGAQPMSDPGGSAVIVFNGEIYNYRQLRDELARKGRAFRSESDTEVFLSAFLEYGIECVHRLNGMFAAGIYDRLSGRKYLLRDRLGVKPLYYAFHDGKLIFASEIKAILSYPGFLRVPDIDGISSYLSCRYPVGGKTLFRGINSLLPGHFLEVSDNACVLKKYWELPVIDRNDDLGEAFYIEKTRELLFDSVSRRMISDVPLGAYLSGGLDSSIIVALMSARSEGPVKTFTVGFPERDYNEFEYAAAVSKRFATDHHEILLDADRYLSEMTELIRFKDAPLGVANEPALYAMSKELKKYITVVLSGEGADEIFGGYGRIFRSPDDYLKLKELSSSHALSGEETVKVLAGSLAKKYGGREFKSEIEHFLFLYQYMDWGEKSRFLSSDFISGLRDDEYLKGYFHGEFDKIKALGIHDKYMWIFEKAHIVGLLQRVDVTTMAASVEARVPFVDHHELVEFALSIPFEHKIRWRSELSRIEASAYTSDEISERFDIPKYLLKKAFESDLPEKITWRRKVGFPVPVHKWIGKDLNEFARDMLLDNRARQRGIYDNAFIEKSLCDEASFERHEHGLKLWMLLNLELWFREYMD